MNSPTYDFKAKLGEITPTFEDEVKIATEKVLENALPWKGYKEAGMIQERELELILKYDKKTLEIKKNYLQEV